jgi:hypothetical protein
MRGPSTHVIKRAVHWYGVRVLNSLKIGEVKTTLQKAADRSHFCLHGKPRKHNNRTNKTVFLRYFYENHSIDQIGCRLSFHQLCRSSHCNATVSVCCVLLRVRVCCARIPWILLSLIITHFCCVHF